MMTLALIIAVSLAQAQTETADTDTVYDIYFHYGGSDQSMYGHMRSIADGQYEIEPDQPWNPDRRKIYVSKSDIIDAKPEDPEHRARRIDKGWKDAGYVMVKTIYGDQPVKQSEVALARRADAMAKEAADAAQPAAAAEAAPEPTPAVAPQPVGFWQQWGGHIGVLVVSFLLVTVVLFTLVLR